MLRLSVKKIAFAMLPLAMVAVALGAEAQQQAKDKVVLTLGQEKISAGILAGASAYMGDYSPVFFGYDMPGVYVQGLINYSLSEYYDVKICMGGGTIGNDSYSYKGRLLSSTPDQMASEFNKFFFDVDVRMEANLLPYSPIIQGYTQMAFTPYCALGAGIAYSGGAPFFQLPISFGIKYRMAYRFTLGVEATFRRTFYDQIDSWTNMHPDPSSITINNNDWISYVGIYITYRMADKPPCPTSLQ
jgi:hypothetical protein